MPWALTTDLEAHARLADPLLRADPVAHTVPLTLLEGLRGGVRWSDTAPVFAHHTRDDGGDGGGGGGTGPGAVDAVAMVTPPHPLVVSTAGDGGPTAPAGNPAAVDVAGLVAAFDGRPLSGVDAVGPVAAAFAAAWRARRGATAHDALRLRLQALGDARDLRDPPATAGTVRAAGPADLDVVAGLVDAMRAELHESGPSPRRLLTDRIAAGAVHLLEVGGTPVALASTTAPVAGVARVATVYTVPAHRRRGHAAVVTAACVRSALARGADRLCLFTDADDPTPNGVYARLGFVAVADRVRWRFDDPTGG